MKFQLGDTVRLADSLFFDPEARGKYGRITRIVKRNGEEPKYTIGDIAGFSCTQEALDEYIELVDRPRANTPTKDPVYILWSPEGRTNPEVTFTTIDQAKDAAKTMARRNQGQ